MNGEGKTTAVEPSLLDQQQIRESWCPLWPHRSAVIEMAKPGSDGFRASLAHAIAHILYKWITRVKMTGRHGGSTGSNETEWRWQCRSYAAARKGFSWADDVCSTSLPKLPAPPKGASQQATVAMAQRRS